MTHFTNLYQFKIESPDTKVSDNKFVESIDAIEAKADKIRLWKDFKTIRYVQALKDHSETTKSEGSYITSMARPLANPS